MRAVSLSLGEAWMHSRDRPMPAPPRDHHEEVASVAPYVSFACNQQLAYCRVTITGSVMQSGALVTRTKN